MHAVMPSILVALLSLACLTLAGKNCRQMGIAEYKYIGTIYLGKDKDSGDKFNSVATEMCGSMCDRATSSYDGGLQLGNPSKAAERYNSQPSKCQSDAQDSPPDYIDLHAKFWNEVDRSLWEDQVQIVKYQNRAGFFDACFCAHAYFLIPRVHKTDFTNGNGQRVPCGDNKAIEEEFKKDYSVGIDSTKRPEDQILLKPVRQGLLDAVRCEKN